jgi:catechol 2,3-dioxygenase-like lactoylglutathione lyase family enzyme
MNSGAAFTSTWFLAGLLCLTAACASNDAERDRVPDTPAAALGPAPFLAAAAIGVSDMDRSFDFYTRVLGMALRQERAIDGFVKQKVLHFAGGKASDVALMSYVDGQPHNYTRNPVKLVFYAPSARALIDAIRGEGLQIIAEPSAQPAFDNAVVAFARDPDGYVLEIVEDAASSVAYLGAIGIGVSDLERSTEFYTRVLHLETRGGVIQIPGVWNEVILRYPNSRGSAVVLMHYTDGTARNYTNNPVQLAFGVSDTASSLAAIEREGLEVLETQIGLALARDPDGYTLELVPAP